MGYFKNYNKARFDVDTEGLDYMSLEDLYKRDGDGATYEVHGLYINTAGYYGDSPTAVIEGALVNLPKHLTKDVVTMLSDRTAVQLIKQGRCAFQIRQYHAKRYDRLCYTIEWLDV